MNGPVQQWKSFSRKQKVVTALLISLFLLITTGALGYLYLSKRPRQIVSIDPNTGDVVVSEETNSSLDGRVTILLVGVDQRANENSKTYNTDSLILASIDPMTEQISLVSIPRDTRVQIPKHGWDKINAAAMYGGLNTTVAVVQQLTGVKIAGYVKTDFQGFKGVIDTLGGITVDVEKDMYYETGDKEDGIINLRKGVQVLDGSKALQYARFRHDAYADITRTARQQVVLKAIAKKTMQAESIPKIPFLIPKFYNAVETNLPLTDLITLAKVAAKFDSAKLMSQTLPGYFLTIDEISYWGVDEAEVKKVVQDLFNGITVGNTMDKLLRISSEPPKPGEKPTPEVPQRVVKIGNITFSAIGSNSITLVVSASTEVAKAEIWRTDLQTPLHTWAGGQLTFPVTKNLESGKEYSYILKIYDDKGNPLGTTSPVVQKTKSVSLSVVAPPDNFTTNKTLVDIFGIGEAASNVIVNGVEVATDSTGKYSTQINVNTEGDTITTIIVSSKDKSQTVTRKVIYDNASVLNLASPPVDALQTKDDVLAIIGLAEPGSIVKINLFNATVKADGSFSYSYTLQQGINEINITAIDLAGNSITKKITVVKGK